MTLTQRLALLKGNMTARGGEGQGSVSQPQPQGNSLSREVGDATPGTMGNEAGRAYDGLRGLGTLNGLDAVDPAKVLQGADPLVSPIPLMA